jgi:hypothetical protein
MKITLSQEVMDQCQEFARKRIEGSSSLYAYRGESNNMKMVEDCVIGTLGEWGVYEYLIGKGYEISKPDMEIYPARRKSFNADLFNKELRIHVKSQSDKSYKYYGSSYLLQKKDRIVTNPDDDEYFVFVKVNGLECEILGSCFIQDIVKYNLWGECKIMKYRHSKIAIYLDDLIKSGINLECL